MSRSNGSQPLPAGQAPQAGGYDVNPDPRAWTPQYGTGQPQAVPQYQAAPQYQAQPQQRPADQGYAPQANPVVNSNPGYGDPYAQQAGYYQAPQPAYAAQPPPAARPAQAAPANYTPQFDPYVTTPAYQPAAAQPATVYPDLRGSAYEHPAYDQWSSQAAKADPRGYDLAAYNTQDQQYASAPQAAPQTARTPAAPQAEWAQSQHYAQQGYDPYQQQAAAQNGQPQTVQQQDYGLSAAAHDQGQGNYNESYASDADAMEGEAPRGRRGFMIAATLAGAILVGGGLTYAYSALLGPTAGGPPPLVKSDGAPSKVKPSEPGGKQFAHADSKVLGRLNDNGTASDIDASGSKKVSTLVVKPDGTIEPPALSEPTPAPEPMAAVPGMSVINVGGNQQTPAAVPAAAEKASPPVQMVQAAANSVQKPLVVSPPAAAPKTPVVISSAASNAAAAPAAASALVETAAVEAPAAASVAPPAVKKPAAVKKVAAVTAPAAAGAAAPAVSSGAGYMAVVASVPASAKSRMDALTQWADMQQKYGSILQGKTMDVQEAKVADKGLYHRLLVGPPSSRDSATAICTQLKSAGHGDCWVMGN